MRKMVFQFNTLLLTSHKRDTGKQCRPKSDAACCGGWSGGAMVLGKLPVPGRPTIWLKVGQGPTVLAVGAGGGCLDIFLSSIISLFFLPLCGRRPDID